MLYIIYEQSPLLVLLFQVPGLHGLLPPAGDPESGPQQHSGQPNHSPCVQPSGQPNHSPCVQHSVQPNHCPCVQPLGQLNHCVLG